MTAFARERELAERGARAAGAVVRRWYERGVGVAEKGPDHPVTRADLEANACIRALVAAAFPDDGWLSEETADSTERLGKRRVWVVDPLDGTPLAFNEPKTLRPGMIASNGVLHDALLALIADVTRGR